ncbi:hypothetical protein FHW00_003249 [Ochrobactrum sp. P6BSIII]|nr:hypothetical protein [Ochrobactrum sp. P6BSIII]
MDILFGVRLVSDHRVGPPLSSPTVNATSPGFHALWLFCICCVLAYFQVWGLFCVRDAALSPLRLFALFKRRKPALLAGFMEWL